MTAPPPVTSVPAVPPASLDELVLNPSARLLWRSHRAVQLELGDHAVVVDGVDAGAVRRLTGRSDAAGEPASSDLDAALSALHTAGFLVRRAPDRRAAAPPVPRLAADLAALRVRHGDGAARILAVRRGAGVAVHGAGRVAALVATLLASAGVGRVAPVARGEVALRHAVPGGVGPADEGERFSRASAAAIHRAAPECDTSPMPAGHRPHLVVLAADGPVDGDERAHLHTRGCAYLAVQVTGDRAVVGPLVLPGLSSCLQCADLHRLERDPAWSALAVQLAVTPRHAAPSDVSLVGLAASVCALQALGYLDGDDPAVLDGTLEVLLPDWRIRRRSWMTHPDCDCGAHTRQASGPAQ